MSNYPPGVTGMEPQIAGNTEAYLVRECGHEGPALIAPHNIDDELVYCIGKIEAGDPNSAKRTLKYLRDLVMESNSEGPVEDVVCPFKGKVEAIVGDSMLTWECPTCKHEHEEELQEEEPDPDRYHDERWFE